MDNELENIISNLESIVGGVKSSLGNYQPVDQSKSSNMSTDPSWLTRTSTLNETAKRFQGHLKDKEYMDKFRVKIRKGLQEP